jgi:diaminohydroxyphosphoribosylaminopyrimidine deaminase/5-amino-6-(5-phosphoribosylamino)uracil reductase
MINASDLIYMQRALDLAQQGLYTTTPNPRVGCVVVAKRGDTELIIGEGFHRRAGEPHAEVNALNQVRAQGFDPHGTTAYVSLEPCCHKGRTPACTAALIEAKVARVVVLTRDPNPLVAGKGIDALRLAGIIVDEIGFDVASDLHQQASDLNAGFFKRMQNGLPWVRLKIASSVDGFTALPDGQSQWITGAAARAEGQRWRARACAVLSTAQTVIDDNARLTVRSIETSRQPIRVILDVKQRLTADLALFADLDVAPVWVVAPNLDHLASLSADPNLRCLTVSCSGAFAAFALGTPLERVILLDLLQVLAREQINELHVEAGATLNGALLQQNLVDEILWFVAPRLLGAGLPMAQMKGLDCLSGSKEVRWMFKSMTSVGDDCLFRMKRYFDREKINA